ncbi:MAG: TIGR04255 family protein [Planctomycetes bacterium]|nr:TIGR04255 family protein [Planctomycetota bacterium]
MPREYEKPPVVEALCEFQFLPGRPWDWTVPGLFYTRVSPEFPRREQQVVSSFEIRRDAREVAHALDPQIHRIQFWRSDSTALVQLGRDLLTVNQLQPYPKWETFKQRIASMLEVYRSVAEPKGFQRVALRYINRILVPGDRVEIEDYIQAVPRIPDVLPQVFATWAQRVEVPYEADKGMLVIQAGSGASQDSNRVVFLLDLGFILTRPEELVVEHAMEWIATAHDRIESAFEACLTEKSRETFSENAHARQGG